MTEVPDLVRDSGMVDAGEPFARNLRAYVAEVAAALGVGLESSVIDAGRPASAYLALDISMTRFPDHDLALLWDERVGWSAAVEAASGEDLVVFARQGGDPRPRPEEVEWFVREVLSDS
ncbi:MAG TPA: DUF6292 family protein [Pseudonocardiaceae bacterium]|nr:DUF6292 family protein [Pseudonocardiaceae bacterium]